MKITFILVILCAGALPIDAAVAVAQDRLAPAGSQLSVSTTGLDQVLDKAETLAPLKTVVIARDGALIAERGFRGHNSSEATNIKSASKTILSALVGIAIDKGVLTGVDQKVAPLLKDDLPASPDPRIHDITIGHLLSMQAGLDRMSGPNYGRWVSSRNWVRTALAADFVDEPGGDMVYSTGSSHLLSAILSRETGKTTMALAREWLGPLDGFVIQSWDRDPQGVYLGGNQMAMSARSLLAFGQLYLNSGRTPSGEQLVAADWISQSWQSRTNSRFSGDGYGYGWFERQIGGSTVHFAWGFGGQMLYLVPELGLAVAMTSDESGPSARTGYRDDLHGLMAQIISVVRNG